MADLASSILNRSAPGQVLRIGYVDSLTPLRVRVEGAPMDAMLTRTGPLDINERVLVIVSAGTVWVVDVLDPRPQTGTVSTISAGLATIAAGGRTYSSVPVRGTTPAVGANVLLVWGSEGVVAVAGGSSALPALPSAPVATQPAPATPAGQDTNRTEEAVVDARCSAIRTARGGSYRGDTLGVVYQGRYSGGESENNTGFFFYGSALQSEGDCLSASIRLSRPRSAGRASNVPFQLRLHDHTKPAVSLPALVGPGPYARSLSWGDSISTEIGSDWGQRLLDGTAKGIAIAYSGTTEYGSLYGPGKSSPLAGQIIIKYRRKVS